MRRTLSRVLPPAGLLTRARHATSKSERLEILQPITHPFGFDMAEFTLIVGVLVILFELCRPS